MGWQPYSIVAGAAISCRRDVPPKSAMPAIQAALSKERKENAAEARKSRLRTQLEADQVELENALLDKRIAQLKGKPLDSAQIILAQTHLAAGKLTWSMDDKYTEVRTRLRRAAQRGDISSDQIDRMDAIHDHASHEIDEYLAKVHDARTQAQSAEAQKKLDTRMKKASIELTALMGEEIKRMEALQAKPRHP